MKLIILLVSILTGTVAHGASATLEWSPVEDSRLGGYTVYKSVDSGIPYEEEFDASMETEYTLHDLDPCVVYYFVVSAYDKWGNESGYSNEVNTSEWVDCDVSGGGGSGGCFIREVNK